MSTRKPMAWYHGVAVGGPISGQMLASPGKVHDVCEMTQAPFAGFTFADVSGTSSYSTKRARYIWQLVGRDPVKGDIGAFFHESLGWAGADYEKMLMGYALYLKRKTQKKKRRALRRAMRSAMRRPNMALMDLVYKDSE